MALCVVLPIDLITHLLTIYSAREKKIKKIENIKQEKTTIKNVDFGAWPTWA